MPRRSKVSKSASAMASARWRGTTPKQRRNHAVMMNAARWKRARKAKRDK